MSDAPFTPVEQTLRTPVEQPNGYFSQSFYSNPQANESDDVLTDADESSKVVRNYSLSFTPVFDQLVLGIYSHILLQPTTTPFLGSIPPLGLVSRVANETFQSLVRHMSSDNAPVYDANCVLSQDHLRNHIHQPIILQLIRKRLLDLCSGLRVPPGAPTQVLVAVSAPNAGLGLRQLLILNLLLSELNVSAFQSTNSSTRLRSSSLNLRKHSLTRNNSYSGSNWLHVGNVQGGRLGMNPELGASTDSLQLMHDYVPQAFIRLAGSLASLQNAAWPSNPAPGFHSMMMDYQTPPTSNKSSVSMGSTPPSTSSNRDTLCMQTPGSGSETEDFGPLLLRLRSLSRGTTGGSFPRPLTINTDAHGVGSAHINGYGNTGEALHSPFISAVTPNEEMCYFGGNPLVLGNVLPNLSGLRSGPLIPESPVKDGAKVSIPGQFSLSEKKRDSLKLKRGIH